MLQYKFLVDDVWQTSPCEPIVSDSQVRLLSKLHSLSLCQHQWYCKHACRAHITISSQLRAMSLLTGLEMAWLERYMWLEISRDGWYAFEADGF